MRRPTRTCAVAKTDQAMHRVVHLIAALHSPLAPRQRHGEVQAASPSFFFGGGGGVGGGVQVVGGSRGPGVCERL